MKNQNEQTEARIDKGSYELQTMICCGMQRSGSTLQFNMLKKILDQAGVAYENPTYTVGADLQKTIDEHKSDSRALLLKSHDLKAIRKLNQEDLILLYTVRDPRDAYVSLKNKRGATIEKLDEIINEFHTNFAIANSLDNILIQRYESIFGEEKNAIVGIMRFLKIELDQSQVESIVQAVSVENFRPSLFSRCYLLIRNSCRAVSRKHATVRFLFTPLRRLNLAMRDLYLGIRKSQVHIDHVSSTKGQSGEWMRQLTVEEKQAFAEKYAHVVNEMGYRS